MLNEEIIKLDYMACGCENISELSGGLMFLEDCKCSFKKEDGWVTIEVSNIEVATPPTL